MPAIEVIKQITVYWEMYTNKQTIKLHSGKSYIKGKLFGRTQEHKGESPL